MLRKALSLILTISLVAAPATPGFAANSNISDTERYVFLNSVADKVEVILRSNITRLEFIKACFQGRNHPSCAAEKELILNNIRMKYANVQQHVFYWHMLRNNDIRRHIQKFFFLSENKNLVVPLGEVINYVDSPLSQIESLSHLKPYAFPSSVVQNIMSRPPLTVNWKESENGPVLKRYKYNLEGLLELTCDRFYKMTRVSTFRSFDIKDAPAVCSQLKISYDAQRKSFIYHNTRATGKDKSFLSHMMSNAHSVDAIKLIENRLFTTISQMPYVGLVRSSQPSNQEMASVFQLMIQNAKEELSVVRKNYRRAFEGEAAPPSTGQITRSAIGNSVLMLSPLSSLSILGKNLVSGLFSSKQEEQTEEVEVNWIRAHGFLAYNSVATSLLDDPNNRMQMMVDTDFNAVYADVESTFANEEMWDLIGELGGTIALTTACFIPIGKAGSAGFKLWKWLVRGKSLSFRSLLCIPMTGVAVNTYFYKQAMSHYHEVYRRVFSTLEGETLLAELRQLTDAEFNIVLEALMFPIGVVSIKALGRVSGKLSTRSINYLKSRI